MEINIILQMVNHFVIDGNLSYRDFDILFSRYSQKERNDIIDILRENHIFIITDNNANVDEEDDEENQVILDFGDDEGDEDEEDDEGNDGIDRAYIRSLFADSTANEEEFYSDDDVKQRNNTLCILIQEGNKQAAHDLCVKNKRLVDKCVIRYSKKYGHNLSFEDLEQVGFMGMLKAAERFDLSKGFSFSTYATWWIRQAISREIMDHGYTIRIPVHMMEKIAKVDQLNAVYYSKGIDPVERTALIAKELGCSEESVLECLNLRENYLKHASLSSPVGEEENSELIDFLPDDETESVENVVMHEAAREALEEVLSTLTAREQDILKKRVGFDDGRPRTLEEIGQEYNVTRERIRQIEAKAIRKLKHPSRKKKLEAFWN